MYGKLDRIYKTEIERTAPDTNDLTLEDGLIRKNQAVLIRSVFVIDQTTANKTMRIGYDRGGTKYWFARKAAGTNVYHISLEASFIITENERLVAMIESSTASDECKLIARGEYL